MAPRWTVVGLKGGLGNQLFQYAFGLARARATGDRLALDTSWFATQGLRSEELSSALHRVPLRELRPRRDSAQVHLDGARPGPTGWADLVAPPGAFGFDPALLASRERSTYFDGYFQSWRYLTDARADIESALALARPSPWLDDMAGRVDLDHSLGVHVRLGDYRSVAHTNRVHGVLPPAYYDAAIDQARDAHGLDSVVLFSDEPDEARALFPTLRDAAVVEPPPESHPMESVYLMSRCGARIIANSSFSWWGSFLAPAATRGATYAPWPWTRSGLDAVDLLPTAWERVDAGWPADAA